MAEMKSERRSLCASVALPLWDTLDCSSPGSSAHGISQQAYWGGLPFSFSRRPGHVQRYMEGREEKGGGGSGKEGGKIKKFVDKPKFIKKPEIN